MTTKPIELLVIEDNPTHLADAKAFIQEQADKGAPVSALYASTYCEAETMLKTKKFAGVISDIFFPYDSTGKNPIATEECLKILSSEEATKILRYEHQQGLDAWVNGQDMHPTGVMIADYAIKNSIPVVLCTDTNHHGSSTQTVSTYVNKLSGKGIDLQMIDADPDDKFNGSVAQKDWKTACATLICSIIEKELQISKTLHDKIFWEKPMTPEEEVLRNQFEARYKEFFFSF